MAQHPFGPIENQLIVGYSKLCKHPCRVKPRFRVTDIELMQNPTEPRLAFATPVFYGWSPANGNSSSHDFRVTCCHTNSGSVNLLSRGLGYRITFTIGETIETEVETTDLFGEFVLGNYKPKLLGSNLRSLMLLLRNFLVVRLEVTIKLIKLTVVTQEGINVHEIPNFDLKSLVTSEQVREVLVNFNLVLQAKSTNERTAFLLIAQLLQGICRHLLTIPAALRPEQKETLKPHLLGCISVLVKYCAEELHLAEGDAYWRPLGVRLQAFAAGVQNWLEAKAPLATESLLQVVCEIINKLETKLARQDHVDRAAVKVAKNLSARERYYYSQTWNAGMGPGSHWIGELLKGQEENTQRDILHCTAHNEFLVSVLDICFRPKLAVLPYYRVMMKSSLQQSLRCIRVIPTSDLVLLGVEEPATGSCWISALDLSKPPGNLIQLKSFIPELPIPNSEDHFKFLDMDTSKATCDVVASRKYRRKHVVYCELTFYSININSETLSSSDTQTTSFELVKAHEVGKYRLGEFFATIKRSNRKDLDLIFVMYWIDKTDKVRARMSDIEVTYSCLHQTEELSLIHSSLTRVPEHQSPLLTPEFEGVWIENRSGKMFGCNFWRSGARLMVNCYHNGRFVPVGQRNASNTGVFDAPSKAKYFFRVNNSQRATGVFAYFGEKSAYRDKLVYRVGLLRLDLSN